MTMEDWASKLDAFPGTVADVSTFLRQAITGKQNSPDLYTVTRILEGIYESAKTGQPYYFD